MKKCLFLLALVLTACVDIPEPNYYKPTNVSPSSYGDLYKSCIAQQAELQDDDVSNANVIGRSISNACNKEYIAYAMQSVSNDNSAVKRSFYHRIGPT